MTHKGASRPYFPELDGLRAIALVMVMVFHLCQHEGIAGLAQFGQTGVDLFFVLSGFLLTTVLLLSPPKDWGEVRTFYARRVFRIFPLYYATLLALVLLHRGAPASFWIFLQNSGIAAGSHVGPNHFWSLAVEEQFYLAQPWAILFLPRRYLAPVLWAVIGGAFVSRLLITAFTRLDVFYLTLCRLDGLAAGCLLAVLWANQTLARKRGGMMLLCAGCGGGVIVGFIFLHGQHNVWFEDLRLSLQTGFYAGLMGLVITAGASGWKRWLRANALRSIGRVSFGAYVFHPFVFDLLYRVHPLAGVLRWLLCFAVTFALVYLSWFGFERHFLRLREVFAPEVKPFAPAVQESLDGGFPVLP